MCRGLDLRAPRRTPAQRRRCSPNPSIEILKKVSPLPAPLAPDPDASENAPNGRSRRPCPGVPHDVASSTKDDLLAAYLERRPALVRSFAARTGSAERAEDVVQDLYVRLQGFSEAQAAEVRNPAAFLYRIGGNLLLDSLRSDRRTAARDKAWTEDAGESVGSVTIHDRPSPEDAAWARLKLDRVSRALEGVPPKAREAFRLHRLDGLTHGQIAERLGVSVSSVEKYLSTVLAHLLKEVGWP